MKFQKKVTVLYHIFYEDTIGSIEEELGYVRSLGASFFFNICAETPNCGEIKQYLQTHFPGSCITISSNKGKDIGGKLLLLKTCIELGVEPEWLVFLHDKKSLQALNAKTWKKELFRIIDQEYLGEVETIMMSQKNCGIIAARNYVQKELIEAGRFVGRNGPILTRLLEQYPVGKPSNEYVAGTMFWAKAPVLLDFFRKHDPLAIRQSLEAGNVLDNFAGTFTHSWERMLSWIVTANGLNIKTV